jgi:RNA polymerase sigma-70 factor (ECF subfamily)
VEVTDKQLWQGIAAGDQAAFAELFRRHLKAVYNYAYRLTASQHVAEDLTSNVFLTAWRKRADVTLVKDSALPWLYTVTSNLARDEFKSSRRRLRLARKMFEPQASEDHADSAVRRVDSASNFHRVVEAIRRLPAAQRRAVELCLVGDMPQPDAAQVLGVSEVTLRSNLSRGRARLREMVEVQEARA